MTVNDPDSDRPGGQGSTASTPWAEFGERLKHLRRRSGLTQRQLGQRVGYGHSLVSRWESGTREPTRGAVDALERALNAGGALSSLVEPPPREGERTRRGGLGVGFFPPLPGGLRSGPVPASLEAGWPGVLPAGACPLHAEDACEVPAFADLLVLPGRMRAACEAGLPDAAEADLIHLLAALLGRCEQAAACAAPAASLGTVEHVLGGLVAWAGAADAAGRSAAAQLGLAAHFAQLAGRLRMHGGQGALAMAWVGHGLRWAEAGGDTGVRATLMTDLCTLARLDGDGASALAYASAIGALDARRGWITALSHMYQARGHAALGDGAETRRQADLSRRCLERLRGRDLQEAPWLAGGQGQLRMEATVAGALRDLAAVTGDRPTARSAARSAVRALEQLPDGMVPTRLLLTVRLADCHVCAGDVDAALQVAGSVVERAVAARRQTISQELKGLRSRLLGAWGGLRETREFAERLGAAVEASRS
ncbi:helix-turn-helix domain-containing protein [Streptomyces sudanensis]|uniref:helix-turn-helix domain-containing protein n=1 Tax=Streptomyces sudanensis TaxID=436397 RepID=UPI0020CE7D1B|nr:helix-turn-helix transcriptional regulator [Streptomyces sudanensis]MCP9985378.1 helix-turn-helix domain-containing protein [Streptomyces sudanensis]